MSEQRTYDAIVVGSGISGGWAAKELCEKGLKTLVLERGRMVKHLKDLRKGKTIAQPIYSYLTCTRAEETIPVKPCHVIIVEGILILTNPELRKMLDIKVFVDADADDRLIRVINRDIVERGRSVNKVMERYEGTVKPMHLQFIEPTKRFADIIVPQGGNNHIAIDILTKYIENRLREKEAEVQ